jgi:hypothetical protein
MYTTSQNEEPIFVFASGQRTGSTLLQRLLNTCSDIMIWGEHDGALQELLWCHQRMLSWQARFHTQLQVFLEQGPNQFLPNIIPAKPDLEQGVRTYLYTTFALPAVRLHRQYWGFKEVRYGIQLALFLQDCFPKARFIHLTRDVVNCLISMKRWELIDEDWQPKWTVKSIQNWQEINESFAGEETAKLFHLMQVRFEDMVADPETFVVQLSDFLQIPRHQFDLNVFNKKLHNTKEKEQIARPKITRDDFSDSDRTLLATPELVRIAHHYGYTPND